MTINAAWLFVLFSAARASAHDYPIAPVAAILRVQPDRVVIDLDSDSVYWIEEVVGLHPMPPHEWPSGALFRVERYVNDHLRLSVAGRRLTGTLIAAEYVQRPWQVYEQGRFRLRLAYPPAPEDATVSGEADFFEEYRHERLESHESLPSTMDFRTLLSVVGRVPHRFELKPGATAFSFPAADGRSGALVRALESVGAGAAAAAGTAWPALAALALSLGPNGPSRRRVALGAACLLYGAAVKVPTPGVLEWAAGLSAALAAGRWCGATVTCVLEATALAGLGAAWSARALIYFPRAVPGLLERAAGAVGACGMAAAALTAGCVVLYAERRRLARVSQAHADELFERRRRLAATALLILSGGGLLRGLMQ